MTPVRRWPALGLLACASLALSACGGGGKTVTVTSTATPRSSSSSSASSSESTAAPPTEGASRRVHEANFKSPSGNISCAIGAGIVRCDITKRRWSPPPRPASCRSEVDFGQGITVGHRGRARFVCAGDTVNNPANPVLAYGTATEVDGFVCLSKPAGVACADAATKHGFTMSAQGYRVF